MEKSITVSELFELIRKGEQPEEITCNGNSAVWDEKEFMYRSRRNGLRISVGLSKRTSGYPVTYDEPILDMEEKRYLSAVIRPFRSKITSIQKMPNDLIIGEYLRFTTCHNGLIDISTLPTFKPGHMYKGMELKRKYTLEELGL